ncbi:MAG: hypothetical protein WD577_10440 [Bacteroidales bacterium]
MASETLYRKAIKLLLYFDVFSYPLTGEELFSYLGIQNGRADMKQEVNDTLAKLHKNSIIDYSEGYYYLGNNHTSIQRRIDGNRLAKKRLKTARYYSYIISCCPFVRGIYLSGSISKGYMGKNDDIDYFIITSPGRLWIARTFLILFKKIFLFNSFRNFCLNYFITEDNLEIKQRNLFTATEIVFLLPVYNKQLLDELLTKNSWVKEYYPEFRPKSEDVINGKRGLKQIVEYLMNRTVATTANNYLYGKSARYIRKKYNNLGDKQFNLCFSLLKNELKYFPENSFPFILDSYKEKLKAFERLSGISLEKESG